MSSNLREYEARYRQVGRAAKFRALTDDARRMAEAEKEERLRKIRKRQQKMLNYAAAVMAEEEVEKM